MFSKAQTTNQPTTAKATTPFFKPEPAFKPLVHTQEGATDRAPESIMRLPIQQVQRKADTPTIAKNKEQTPFFRPLSTPIQAKLTVGQPNDQYEQEADAVADRVVQRLAMPNSVRPLESLASESFQTSPMFNTSIQRACAACEKEDKDHIQRKESGDLTASSHIESRLSATKGGGSTLPESTRTQMESAIGADFSNVRIHTGNEAVQLSRDLSAHAFTHGSDVYFNAGKFAPNTEGGRHLLAHELVHTVQQGNGVQRMIQRVELTYDDGPDSSGNTRSVLNSLNSAGAKATFYLVGQRVLEGTNWQVVFDIAKSGHWLGNHAFDWNNTTDNHIFLHGTMADRTVKILETEIAIREALRTGKASAIADGSWTTIPLTARTYIDDVIATGTGRFRTPGFRSHWYTGITSADGITTQAAIETANRIAATAGLRRFIASDSVDVDPEDWRRGRTATQIESAVTSDVDENSDSILLHSRIAATANATPNIVAEMTRRGYSWTAPARGQIARVIPKGLANLTVSDPPTHAEIMQARSFLMSNLSYGGLILGETAIGILQMAHAANRAEVNDFLDFIETTPGPPNTGYMSNFLLMNDSFRVTYLFLTYWLGRKPLPANYQAGGRPAGP